MRRAILAVLVALVLGACGEREVKRAPEPAALVPANAVAVLDVIVRPDVDQMVRIASLARRALPPADDTEEVLRETFDRVLRDASGGASLERDVLPWLGERATIFELGSREVAPRGVIVEARDLDAAREAVERVSGRDSEARSHRGVAYRLTPDDFARGVVSGHVVIAPESVFQAVVDVSAGGRAVVADREYRAAGRAAPRGALARFFARAEWVATQVEATDALPARATARLRRAAARPAGRIVTGALSLRPDGVRFDLATGTALASAVGISPVPPPLLEDEPSGSWLSLGVGELGRTLGRPDRPLALDLPVVAPLLASVPGVDLGAPRLRRALARAGLTVSLRGQFATGFGARARISGVPGRLGPDLVRRADRVMRRRGLRPRSGRQEWGIWSAFRERGKRGSYVEINEDNGKLHIFSEGPSTTRVSTTLRGADSFRAARDALDFPPWIYFEPAPILRFARDADLLGDPDIAAAETVLAGVRYVTAASDARDGRTVQQVAIGVR